MACYGCGTGFSVFKKEHGCKNCGFAFCSKCLTKSIEVPKLKNSKHKVCNKCYDILTGKITAEDNKRFSPPKAYQKRIAALEEREKNPGASSSHSKKPGGHVNKKYIGLSKADREIAERLDKLKESKQPEVKTTDKDIAGRLSRLKGEEPSQHSHKQQTHKFYHPPDTRPQQKQVDDLLDEICDEVEIDSHRLDPVNDVQQRLDQLKGANGNNNELQNNLDRKSNIDPKQYNKNINNGGASCSGDNGDDLDEMNRLIIEASKELDIDANKAIEDLKKDKEIMDKLNEIKDRKKTDTTEEDSVKNDSDSDNDEETVKNLVKRYLEESKLDEAVGEVSSNSKSRKRINTPTSNIPEDYDDADELPYCCMCTEDATIRCLSCDMDLYCKRCFRESHDEMDIKDHKTKPYTPPKGYKD